MTTLTYAFYKGTRAENAKARLFDRLVTSWPRTRGRFSHGEWVAPSGECWSSSFRDGGVRGKLIDVHSGRWVLVTVPATPDEVAAHYEWCALYRGAQYDWPSLLGFVLPWRVSVALWWFCTEALAAMRGLDTPRLWHPNKLFEHLAGLPGAVVFEPTPPRKVTNG